MKKLRFKGIIRAVLFLVPVGNLLISLPGRAQEEEEGEFKGAGIHLRLRGAWTMFSGGDLKKGTTGMYDQAVADILSLGYESVSNDKEPLGSGAEITGDLVYYFTPKLGLGIGGGWIRTRRNSVFRFGVPGGMMNYMMMGAPNMDILSLRLGLFYASPLNRLLTVCLHASPAYYFADFQYGQSFQTPSDIRSIIQSTKARNWGLEGGIGLEIRMNQRLALILQAQGRYAKISGFDGTESIDEFHLGQSTVKEENGWLYLVEEEFPRLDIDPEGPPVGVVAKKAVLDLSGVSFQAGLNFKF